MLHKRVRYRTIDHERMGIDEVNEILISQYQHDLYGFALSLAVVLNDYPMLGFCNIWEIKKAKIPGIETVKAEIERLSDIRSRIMGLTKSFRLHLGKLPRWHEIKGVRTDKALKRIVLSQDFKNMPNANEIIRKIYKIEDTISIIDEEISFLRNNMWKPFRKGPGKSGEPSIIIHAFWSLVIRKNRNSDMENVEELVKWFAKKLKNTSYGAKLDYKFVDPSLYRFRTENLEKLEEDKAYFFPNIGNSKEAKLTRFLQIQFADDCPKIAVFNSRCKAKQSPLIIFPDGSTYS